MKKTIILCSLVFVAFFLTAAFVAWEINPAKWHTSDRFILIWICFCICFGIVGYRYEEKKAP